MPNSLGADELIGQALHLARLSPQHHHFQTGVVIEMGMESGDDDFVAFVLKIGELFWQKAGVKVVNQRDRADDQGICGHHDRTHQTIANQIAKRLGSVLVTFVRYKGIKATQEF